MRKILLTGLERVLRFSIARPGWVFQIVLVLVLGAAFFVPRIELRLDGRSLIPAGHPEQIASDRAAARFDHGDVVVVGVVNNEEGIYHPPTLELITELSTELAEIDGIDPSSVSSLATLPRLFVADNVLDPEPLLSQQRAPGSGYRVDAETARRLARETRLTGLEDGILVAADGRAAAIYAAVEPGADRDAVLEAVRRLVERPTEAGESLHLSGTALAQAILGRSAARDLVFLVPGVIALLGLVLTLLFRHPAPALVSLAEIGASLVVTAGVMGLAGEAVFVTTLVLPVVLIVIGVSDDVYVLHRYFRRLSESPGEKRPQALFESFRAVAMPILLTSVTTMAGLLSLTVTELEPQRIFGLYGALAILLSTILTFTLLPAMLRVLPAPRARLAKRRYGTAFFDAWWKALSQLGPRRFALLLTAVAMVCALLARNVEIDDDWVRNLPPKSDIAQGDQTLNERLAGTIRVELDVDARERQGFLESDRFATLGALEEALEALPEVGAVRGIYSDVVRLRAGLEGHGYEQERRRLEQGPPLSGIEIDQALLLLNSLRRVPMGENIDESLEHARVTAFVPAADYRRIERVVAAAEAVRGELAVTPFGDGWVSYLAVRLLVVGQVKSVALALLTDALLLFFLFRSLGTTLLAITPIVLAVLAVFASLAVFGMPLGIANSMFAAVALGIGVDYSIHLVAHFREEMETGRPPAEAMRRALVVTGPAILMGATAVTAGLSILLFSQVAPNLELGLLICSSLAACALATLVVVPGLALFLVPAAAAPKVASNRRFATEEGKSSVHKPAPGITLLLVSLSGLALLGLALLGLARPAAAEEETAENTQETAAPAVDARALVEAYNARPFGDPAGRRVRLDLMSGTKLTRSFTVSNLWRHTAADELRTLFLLEEPENLRGTLYLLVERPTRQTGMEVYLFLPAGRRRVLSIEPSRFGEGLLGSDFGYRDLRLQIPTAGFDFALAGRDEMLGREVWIVEARPREGESSFAPALSRYYLASEPPLLLGADHFATGAALPSKQMRVHGVRQDDGAWTETRIVMESADGHSSILTLQEFRPEIAELPVEIFVPERLPRLAETMPAKLLQNVSTWLQESLQ